MEETAQRKATPHPRLADARARLLSARRVLGLTGAGISAESGVPTFRGSEGLWRQFRPEDLATAEAFARDPRLVWEWYAWRRERIAAARPNAGHQALARLDARTPEFLLATQNVDGLHALAGSRRLVELHGSIWQLRCVSCGAAREVRGPLGELPPRCSLGVWGRSREAAVSPQRGAPGFTPGAHSECGAVLRPGVVWFGEALPESALTEAFEAARQAEVVLVVGTSSLVYPAAALPQVARAAGAFVVEINAEETPLSAAAQVSVRGRAAEVLPQLVPEGGA